MQEDTTTPMDEEPTRGPPSADEDSTRRGRFRFPGNPSYLDPARDRTSPAREQHHHHHHHHQQQDEPGRFAAHQQQQQQQQRRSRAMIEESSTPPSQSEGVTPQQHHHQPPSNGSGFFRNYPSAQHEATSPRTPDLVFAEIGHGRGSGFQQQQQQQTDGAGPSNGAQEERQTRSSKMSLRNIFGHGRGTDHGAG